MRKRKCRVYLLRVTLRNEILYKIGITCRRLNTRVIEIADSFLKANGYVPMIEVLRGDKPSSRCFNYFGVESHLLWMYKMQKVSWVKKFSGSSEFRRLDTRKSQNEEKLLSDYDKTMKELGAHVTTIDDDLSDIKDDVSNEGRLENVVEVGPVSWDF